MSTRIVSWIMSVVAFFTSVFSLVFGSMNKNKTETADIRPDTWAAVDGLGRTLPMAEEVKKKDDRKFVGMFYWIWHTSFAQSFSARNITEILAEHPEIVHDFNSPFWENTSVGYPHYWNKPLFGYYRDTDAYVLRKHAELLADAGVDVIVFDCTNGTATWDESYEKLFEVFEAAKADGVHVPQVAFMLPFNDGADTTTSLKNLYERIYSKGRYSDLWFIWDNKPLIMAHSSGLNKEDAAEKEILDFFTFRENDPAYFSGDTKYKEKTWGWCSTYPQTKYGKTLNGRVEQMCVSVAQNAADGRLVAMNADADVQGRGYSEGNYSYSYQTAGKTVNVSSDMENALLYGVNFQQQWDNAIAANPDFIFVTGWNEWIAGRWDEWCGTENAFPDEFNDEFSRDIEPAEGILKDHYYYQLVSNIRRFKGISDGTLTKNGKKTYYHYTNSTYVRDSDSWQGGEHYSADTMRNDFVKTQVWNDGEYIYMTVYTKDAISPASDPAWMRVFIDTDPSGVSPHWEGFEYVVNRANAAENTVTVERSLGGWAFEQTGTARYTVSGNVMELKIPVSALGLSGSIRFNFKLSDNMQTDGDVLDFYKSGDVAPGGRFMFVY